LIYLGLANFKESIMPSSSNYVRDYKQEVKTLKRRGEDKDQSVRHKARRLMLKRGAVKPGQDVDHKRPLSKGGSNSASNLRAQSPSKNRSFSRTKKGAIKHNK
jgi:5-methylcytosine-specific restriction endonuclease McrA